MTLKLKSKPINKDLMFEVADIIEKKDGAHDQHVWLESAHDSGLFDFGAEDLEILAQSDTKERKIESFKAGQVYGKCGTQGCIAGWAVLCDLKDDESALIANDIVYELDPKTLNVSQTGTISSVAREILGLTRTEASILFHESFRGKTDTSFPETLRDIAMSQNVAKHAGKKFLLEWLEMEELSGAIYLMKKDGIDVSDIEESWDFPAEPSKSHVKVLRKKLDFRNA